MTDPMQAVDEGRLREEQERKNLKVLVVLVAVILVMILLSYPLFNNYWDPSLSDKVISH